MNWGNCGNGSTALIQAADEVIDGSLAEVGTVPDANFGLNIPESCVGVPAEVLNPKNTWADGTAYDEMAREVAKRFEANFKQFEGHVGAEVTAAGIHAAA